MVERGWEQDDFQVAGETKPEVGEDFVDGARGKTAFDEVLRGDAPTEKI